MESGEVRPAPDRHRRVSTGRCGRKPGFPERTGAAWLGSKYDVTTLQRRWFPLFAGARVWFVFLTAH